MRTYTEKDTKQSYLPPCIELMEIVVEKGFTTSINNFSPSDKATEWLDGTEYLEFD